MAETAKNGQNDQIIRDREFVSLGLLSHKYLCQDLKIGQKLP